MSLLVGLCSNPSLQAEHAPSGKKRAEAPASFSSDAVNCRSKTDLLGAYGFSSTFDEKGSYLLPAVRDDKNGFYVIQHTGIYFFEVPSDQKGFLTLKLLDGTKVHTRVRFVSGAVWPNPSAFEVYPDGQETTSVKQQLSRSESPILLPTKIQTDDGPAVLAIRKDLDKRLRSIPKRIGDLLSDGETNELSSLKLRELDWPDGPTNALKSCVSEVLGVPIAVEVQEELRLLHKGIRREKPFNTVFDEKRSRLQEANPPTPSGGLKR